MHRSTRRVFSLVTGVAVTATAVATMAVPAQAATGDPVPAQQGAAWLADELGGGMFTGAFNQGLSIDAALALIEVGAQPQAVQGVSQALKAGLEEYISFEGTVYPGSAAKAAVMALEAGEDPTDYAGIDLIDEVEQKVVGGAVPAVGEVPDTNVFGQALAARALDDVDSAKTEDVVSFLLRQQCSDGYFRLDYDASWADPPIDPAQTCDEAGSAADTDATAYAVLQLATIDTPAAGVTQAVADAKQWLLDNQLPNGAWVGTGTGAANANSTGLAAWALGDTPASRKAAIWLRQHQVRDAGSCRTKLSDEQGAVALDDQRWSDGVADGITAITRDTWWRASAQALPALRYLPAPGGRLTASGPAARYVKAGSTKRLAVGNAASYGQVCAVRGTAVVGSAVSAAGTAILAVKVPKGTKKHTWTVSDSNARTGTVTLHALAKKKLRPKLKKSTVHRAKKAKVVLKGLAPKESVKVRWRGKVVAKGLATKKGVFRDTFKVGKKLGKAKVMVRGEFGNRKGVTKLRVRR